MHNRVIIIEVKGFSLEKLSAPSIWRELCQCHPYFGQQPLLEAVTLSANSWIYGKIIDYQVNCQKLKFLQGTISTRAPSAPWNFSLVGRLCSLCTKTLPEGSRGLHHTVKGS